jgi:hypothetical protein
MKAAVVTLLSSFVAGATLVQMREPPDSATRPALTQEGYHVAYTRRGCRVDEKWDGVRYRAWVACAPGVRPN